MSFHADTQSVDLFLLTLMADCQLIEDETDGLTDDMKVNMIQQTLKMRQKLLFDGYLRMQIVRYIQCDFLIPQDVMNLCQKFFEIDIKSLPPLLSSTEQEYRDLFKVQRQTICKIEGN